MSKIGILGSGNVGQTLAKGFKKYEYDVMIGTGHPDKVSDFAKEQGIKLGTFAQAAEFGELIVLCVKGDAAAQVITSVSQQLSGKTVLDTTNALVDHNAENGVLKLFTTWDESLMEQLQSAAPEAKFVKALNSVGANLMINPPFTERPSMYICGNDQDAKKEVGEILEKFGFEPADMGMATSARALEPLVVLWLIPAFLKKDRDHAYKHLQK